MAQEVKKPAPAAAKPAAAPAKPLTAPVKAEPTQTATAASTPVVDEKVKVGKAKELSGDTGKIKALFLKIGKMQEKLDFRGASEEDRKTIEVTRKTVNAKGEEITEVKRGEEAEGIYTKRYYSKFGRMIEKDMNEKDHSDKNTKAKAAIKKFISSNATLELQKKNGQPLLDELMEIYKPVRKERTKSEKVIEPIALTELDWL